MKNLVQDNPLRGGKLRHSDAAGITLDFPHRPLPRGCAARQTGRNDPVDRPVRAPVRIGTVTHGPLAPIWGIRSRSRLIVSSPPGRARQLVGISDLIPYARKRQSYGGGSLILCHLIRELDYKRRHLFLERDLVLPGVGRTNVTPR
jgi:hypothetical protein